MSFWDFLVAKGDDVLTFMMLGTLSLQQSGLIEDPRITKWLVWGLGLGTIAHKVFLPGAQTPQGVVK